MFEPHLERNRANDFTETCYFEILDAPDIKHEGTEFLTDEADSLLPEINGIEMMFRQLLADRVVRRRKVIDQLKYVRQIAPQYLFLKRTEAERRGVPLLNDSSAITGLQAMASKFIAKPLEPLRRQIVAEEFHGIGIG